MEIRNVNVNSINAYKKLAKTTAVKKNGECIKNSVKTDKVEFDFGRYLESAKANAASRVDNSASEERLAALAKQYAGDNCPVAAEDVASSILG